MTQPTDRPTTPEFTKEDAAAIRVMFHPGAEFYVDEDPDNPDFFSVFSYAHGAGCEVAGKIGEETVAKAIANALRGICNPNTVY